MSKGAIIGYAVVSLLIKVTLINNINYYLSNKTFLFNSIEVGDPLTGG